MNRVILKAFVLAVVVFGMAGPATAQTRIMPLGDSITQGGQGYASYRYELWFDLLGAGYSVDFVGRRDFTNGGDPVLTWYPEYLTTFDRDHEGYWGWRTDEIATIVLAATTAAQPEIVLIHLGTNDIGQMGAAGVVNADANLRAIIGIVRAVVPDVTILLAQVIPIGPGTSYFDNADQVDPLNTYIAAIAADSTTSSSPVIVVDQNSGFDLGTMMQNDGLHPNLLGEAEMASVWVAVLDTVLVPGNVPPYVSITTPVDGAFFSVPTDIAIAADATDADGTVVQVSFFADSMLLDVDTTTPFATYWTAVPTGVYTLTAVAEDDSGATRTSMAVSVSVLPFTGGTPILIENPNFEIPVLADGALAEGPGVIGGWTFSGTSNTFTGIFNPPAGSYPTAGGDGIPTGADSTNASYLFNNGGAGDSVSAVQVLTDTLATDTEYLLNVAIGRFLPNQPYAFSTYGGYRIELLAGSTVIAQAVDLIDPPAGEFRDAFAFVSSNDLDSALIGSPLSIRLDISANDSPRSTHFDNVRLVRRDAPTGIRTSQGRPTAGIRVCPNPFNAATTISYTVPSASAVTIVVYDVRGRLVDRLVDRLYHEAGEYHIHYEAASGTGVYFLRVEASGKTGTGKLLLLK
jgi:lysophospholipase L1-like esterase